MVNYEANVEGFPVGIPVGVPGCHGQHRVLFDLSLDRVDVGRVEQ